ncbi:hypothetical protein Dda_5941 [Drechslerella dactyloides]|uniref:Uncharacterized protein n=1 Tax=Drechslerella dactyloides TaxID=74499 RepID=A0AAD6NI14_DREDA|nr:hypothetical protein Dda_5941 [Drechslerella dactyloides]
MAALFNPLYQATSAASNDNPSSYLHTWNGTIAPSQALTNDTRRIISDAKRQGIRLARPSDARCKPVVTRTNISLRDKAKAKTKGKDKSGLFILSPGVPDTGFCRTEGKAYDAVVCAILLRCWHYNRATFQVSSRRAWENWTEGRRLYFDTFREEAVMPSGMLDRARIEQRRRLSTLRRRSR